jgi:hypothetical protein
MTSLQIVVIVSMAYFLLGVGFLGLLSGAHGNSLRRADFWNPLIWTVFLVWPLILIFLIPKAVYKFFYKIGYFLGAKF